MIALEDQEWLCSQEVCDELALPVYGYMSSLPVLPSRAVWLLTVVASCAASCSQAWHMVIPLVLGVLCQCWLCLMCDTFAL